MSAGWQGDKVERVQGVRRALAARVNATNLCGRASARAHSSFMLFGPYYYFGRHTISTRIATW